VRELANLLRALSSRDPAPRVAVRAGGQSLDGQALSDDTVIQIAGPGFDWIADPDHDEQGPYVTTGAAATWGSVLAATSARGLIPYSMVTTSHATVGGTLSSDCLSRCSALTGREGTHVRSFKLLTVGGELIECRRDDWAPDRAELFRAVIAGYGYLGVVTQVTFDLRPALPGWTEGKPLSALTHVTKVSLREGSGDPWAPLLEQLREPQGAGAASRDECPRAFAPDAATWDAISSSVWFAHHREQVLLYRSRYVVAPATHPLPVYERTSLMGFVTPQGMVDHILTEAGETAYFAFCREGCHTNKIDEFTFFMEHQFGPPKELANREGWRLNIIQQTFVLPAGAAGDPAGNGATATFLSELRARLGKPARPTMIDVLYLPADEFLLSANRAMPGYAVTISWADRNGRSWDTLSDKLRLLARRCRELGGRVHLVKNVVAAHEDLAAMYGPAFERFLTLKRRYDPRGILRNDFFDRVFGTVT
jgi:decaprenylphospho-beta-D-ribofuranose 2-oxidase